MSNKTREAPPARTAEVVREYGPFESWYEAGPDPVYAAASETEETTFVRVMLVPRELEGKRTVRYANPEDEQKPKLQRARIYLERAL